MNYYSKSYTSVDVGEVANGNRVCEDEADNRHFVAHLKKDGNALEGKRLDVYVSFLVHKIHEVNIPKQRFHAHFNVHASWKEKNSKAKICPDYDASSEIWTAKMFAECSDPHLRMTNCIEMDKDDHEEWFKVAVVDEDQQSKWNKYRYISVNEFKGLNDDISVWIVKSQRIRGWFEEDFEMMDFPLDVQHLHLGVMSRWDETRVALSFDRCQPSTVSSQALSSQEFIMSAPRLLSYQDDWDSTSLGFLTKKADSASGARYCKAYFAMTIYRKPGSVMWNVMFIMTIVGFFSFAAFAVPINEIGTRLSVVLTMVLTTVAFKYVTINMMPTISYFTMIDFVIYGCMILQALMVLGICIATRVTCQKKFDQILALVLASVWGCLLIWFVVRFFWLCDHRRKYISECNRRYDDIYDRRKNHFYTIADDTVESESLTSRFHQVKRSMNVRGNFRNSLISDRQNKSKCTTLCCCHGMGKEGSSPVPNAQHNASENA